MKALVAMAILPLALQLSAGCGSGATRSSSPDFVPAAPPPMLTWNNNSNSLVPFCPATAAPSNCIANYTIRNATTSVTVTVDITATSYGPVDLADSYEIRVNGFDGNGNPISSPYAAFPTTH